MTPPNKRIVPKVSLIQRRGSTVANSGIILSSPQTSFEAQYLANQVQLYYNSQDAERCTLLQQFNHDPEKFDYRLLLEQLANSSVARAQQTTSQSALTTSRIGV